MKDQILKIAGVKSEKAFYKKYPTEAAFKKAHGKALKKAAMGASMVKKQLIQLTDYSNPPQAEMGKTIGFSDLLANAEAQNLGMSKEGYNKLQQQTLESQNADKIATSNKGQGFGDIMNQLMNMELPEGPAPLGTPSVTGSSNSTGIDVFGNYTGAKNGKKIPKALFGLDLGALGSAAKGISGGSGGGLGDAVTKGLGKLSGAGGGLGKAAGALNSTLGKLGGAGNVIGAATDIMGGISQMKEQKKALKQADQTAQISGLTAMAAESQPERIKNKYVRPEDALLGSANPQGTGTNFLARNGMNVGGNLTEIQNTYNSPLDIYSDLGYEPLNNSNVKQFAHGGNIPSAELGDYFKSSGQGSIGKGVGSAIGTAFLGPVGGMIGGVLGNVAGNLLGGAKDANKLAALQDEATKNTERSAFAQGSQQIHAQNSAFMEDGGWMSNDWQPQVIATFGEHSMHDLLKPPHDADMLRSGGHLKEYTPPTGEALQTYAMGGELQTHWGGYAEPVSTNPYLPDGGQTVMFRGQSHDDTNNQGQSGIGVTYGNNPVEVERGEPAVKLQDGGSPEGDNLVVYGNMVIPKYGVTELNDKKATGKKFKNYIDDLNNIEVRQNKIINKAKELANDTTDSDPFSKLTLNSAQANMIGADMKLKDIANKKTLAAGIQNAILDTAKEHGLVADDLAKGKMVKDKEAAKTARFGAKMETAQDGLEKIIIPDAPLIPFGGSANYTQTAPVVPVTTGSDIVRSIRDAIPNSARTRTEAPYKSTYVKGGTDIIPMERKIASKLATPSADFLARAKDHAGAITQATPERENFDWTGIAESAMSNLAPLLRPSDQEGLDPNQLMGEQYALATNQLEAVKAQQFTPMLDESYKISLQDQLNQVDAQSNAAIRAAGQNPSAQAFIMAQAADQKNKIRGEELRINQSEQARVSSKNRDALNQAQLQNLGIMDQQYVRQATAKSRTKEQALAALNSISSKIAQNKLENRQLGIQENLYNYRFGPNGQAINVNAPAKFNMEGSFSNKTTPVAPEGYEYTTELKKIKAKESRNGSIVKALKSL